MSSHLVLPLTTVASLRAAFDTDWITALAAEVDVTDPRYDIAPSSAVARSLRARAAAAAAGGAAVHDAAAAAPAEMEDDEAIALITDSGRVDLTGKTMNQLVREHVDARMREWREAAAREGIDPLAVTNLLRKERRKALPKSAAGQAAREIADELLASVGPLPVNAAHPAVQDVLAHTSSIDDLRESIVAKFAGGHAILRNYGGPLADPTAIALSEYPIYDVDRAMNVLLRPQPAQRNGGVVTRPVQTAFGAADVSAAQPCDVVIRVTLYHPQRAAKLQEFEVLGSNTLEQLRDRIRCPADDEPAAHLRKQSAFYIEGVVFQDTRAPVYTQNLASEDRAVGLATAPAPVWPTAVRATAASGGHDLGAGDRIAAWLDLLHDDAAATAPPPAAAPSLKLLGGAAVFWSRDAIRRGRDTGWGPLQLAGMTTRFDELAFRPGAHYLFVHQGTCEHIMVITDARLASSTSHEAGFDTADYPLQTFQARTRRRHCEGCARVYASVLVWGDRATAANPTYLCEPCHRALHYDAAGRLLYGDFMVQTL